MSLLKRTFICALAVSLIGTALCGCSVLKSFEKDFTVNVLFDEQTTIKGTVNIFNNYVLPAPPSERNDEGIPFLGWSLKRDFISGEDDESLIFKAGGVIRYDDVSSYGGEVNLYPIYQRKKIVYHYLTVGYYAKESTSGLNEGLVTNFINELETYLAANGATAEQLEDVIVVAYNGAIADVGNAVNDDGNVDIIMGVGKNLQSQGGIIYVERTLDLKMGNATSRVIARLSDRGAAKAAYDWMIANAALLEG